ncbi:amidohydrolase [Falsiroseomonas bella]|uniref:Amidohydrolase n=1 Tax=Falsiroseomonas bella TaxID=2184016 RepID=A0A317F4R1_9PROT|nr:M20 aminoacylase family protein [Falsiroseomonas bella]PWS34151.1 amidohydrolase [Falsiroseomonas bella]
MPVINRIAEFHPEMTAWRRDFHQHPELGFDEVRTAGIVAAKLKEFGCDEVHTGIAKTGVVGVIRGNGNSGRAIGFRADMDALPLQELTGLPHASTIPGRMHACGHDGHTTMLLGAAKYLAETRNFDGTVYLVFQPAEENLAGGEVMVKEGLFERFPMERIFGMHNWPGAPAGTFLHAPGPVMAAVANLEATITGRGAHGAMPHNGVDPILIASHIVAALQSVVARNVNPLEAGVITIAHFTGGHTFNVIPESVHLQGTARWFLPEVGNLLERRFKEIVTGIAIAMGGSAECSFARAYPATVNEPESTEIAARAARSVTGEARTRPLPQPTMGGEDFSFMLEKKAGAYLFLGGGKGPEDAMVHHPKYDFNDEILPVGASWFATLAEQIMPRRG